MRSVEEFVAPGSDYYIHTPSRQAESMLLFPLQAGHFIYAPGYTLRRESFDSFLLMYIQKGSLTLTFEGRTRHVSSGSFILIDCCKLHAYAAQDGCECLWCHFDGVTARGLYNAVTSRLGCVFTLAGELPPLRKLQMIYDAFKGGGPVREPSMHKYLTDIMTSFLLASPHAAGDTDHALIAEEITTYIAEHFSEDIRVEDLAARASMSLYHFIRVFKRETGFTPHEYLLNVRMATAKYLLKNSRLTVKAICYAVGYSSESVFCGAFKRAAGVTPAQYRSGVFAPGNLHNIFGHIKTSVFPASVHTV